MINLEPFWLCTNSIPVRDPVRVVGIAKELGFSTIEFSAIDGNNEQIVAEQVSPYYVARIRRALEQNGITCYALSAHTDLTDRRCFERFLKKVRFAGEIGVQRINTRCGPKKDIDAFFAHIREVIPYLEHYGIRLNLETYGDIVSEAKQTAGVFEVINHPLVGYNYDAGNLYRFTHGTLDFEEDLPYGLKYLDCIHLKDVYMKDGYLYNTAVGEGVIGYQEFLETLSGYRTSIGAGLETPLGFRVRDIDLDKQIIGADLETSLDVIRRSVTYLEKIHAIGGKNNESNTCNDFADKLCKAG